MFASLKNKIKEEIGSDVSTVIRNAGGARMLSSKHRSQAGSSSSVNSSQVSLNECNEECATSPLGLAQLKQSDNFDLKLIDGTVLSAKDIKRLENRENEWRKILHKREAEYNKKLEKKEEEFKIKISEKEKDWKKVLEKLQKENAKLIEERLKAEIDKQSSQLALNNVEEYRKKLHTFQENAEQMEGFQNQEMAKIKQLYLSKEQESEDKTHRLKIALGEIENLKMEVSRLRRYESELSNIQEQSAQEIKKLNIELEEAKGNSKQKDLELNKLVAEINEKTNSILHLESEVQGLRKSLESEETKKVRNYKDLEQEKNEKVALISENTSLVEEIESARKEMKRKESENLELQSLLKKLQESLNNTTQAYEDTATKLSIAVAKTEELEKLQGNAENSTVSELLVHNRMNLEQELFEKNKTIKVLQQRLSDMKKTLQKELKVSSHSLDSDSEPLVAVINPSSSNTVSANHSSLENDVNFQYLKHVIMKFLTSREYEALNLTKAVATLLHFTKDEEKLLQETLEWKMSWFGTKPNLGFGQTAKAIPPS